VVLVNLWSFHNDADFWGDPQNFRPERFLDEKGQLLKANHSLPFGAGECFLPQDDPVQSTSETSGTKRQAAVGRTGASYSTDLGFDT
jgi:hypothetical protein